MVIIDYQRFNVFKKSAEGLGINIFDTKLQALKENKIIEKLDDPESKSKGYYKLTQIGVDLLPILIEIGLWSEKYFPITEEIKTILIEVKKDKAKFINKTIAELTNN